VYSAMGYHVQFYDSSTISQDEKTCVLDALQFIGSADETANNKMTLKLENLQGFGGNSKWDSTTNENVLNHPTKLSELKRDFINSTATLLGVTESQIKIVDVRAGSVEFVFEVNGLTAQQKRYYLE